MPVQFTVKDGTGGWLVGVPEVPGLMTTENSCSPPAAVLVVAVPVGTAAVEAGESGVSLPLPVPGGVARGVLVAGLVQVWVTEDFSLQELTSQELACETATVGETWLVEEVVPAVWAD